MRKTRWLAAFILPFILVSFLQSQSLAELAKKEKERRASLKGRTARVITTADLAKVKKRPAVETAVPEQTVEEGTDVVPNTEAAGQVEGQAQEAQAQPATVATGEAAAAETPSVKPAEEPKPQPAEPPAAPALDSRIRQAELAKAAQDKQELVDLLTLKMNALYQELYTLDNLKSRELLQAQISDTYDKLLKAEADATKAVKDLDDFVAAAKKEQTPGIWIK